MCSDLLLSHPEPRNLHIVPTERDTTNNLALSSRNAYLSREGRKVANTPGERRLGNWAFEIGMCSKVGGLGGDIRAKAAVEVRLDYVELNDSDGSEVVGGGRTKADYWTRPVLLSGALWVGRTRLIDNLILGDPSLLGILNSDVRVKI